MDSALAAISDYLQLEALGLLLLAVVLAGVLGSEREIAGQAAGLRTHVLVSLGAACFTLVSIFGFIGFGTVQDPGRVAAQIVTGVGFLGAGAIWRSGASVRGLTTAASIWMAAAVGMMAGSGLYVLAVGATALAWLVLYAVKRFERRLVTKDGQD